MGLDLPSGGHLTHGFFTNKKKISATSVFYESLPYTINDEGYIDYDNLEELAKIFKPKLIICGASAYPRDIDYKRFREIANLNNSYLLCDMAHISGFIATNIMNSPFEYCDVVTTTTHKTLRGPRSGMIFYKQIYKEKINFSVFPMLQGGPHQHQIAGIASQLLEVQTPEYLEYIKQVKLNSHALVKYFVDNNYNLSTNGTDNHIILINLKNKNITGSKIEKICDRVNISLNKNSIKGDKSATSPSGIRIGTTPLTTRGFKENDFIYVGELLNKCIDLALIIQTNNKSLKDFMNAFKEYKNELDQIKTKVNDFAKKFDFIEFNI
jgi:glycine hydroxymethyltransferase